MKAHRFRFIVALFALCLAHPTLAQKEQQVIELTPDRAVALAELALKGIDREYPNKPSEVLVAEESLRSPRTMHPAFYGCFDWHSSVHGHWMLVRLLKQFPEMSINSTIRKKLSEHLTLANIQTEVEYFEQPENKSFERMYGWAWALRLAVELQTWDDKDGRAWAENFKPLEEVIVERSLAYLPNLEWPIRTGVHPDTGFALGQLWDYANQVGHQKLKDLIRARSMHYYSGDRDYPIRYEPSGEDFFSSCLNEADLMRRVLSSEEFEKWLDRYLPSLEKGELGNLAAPVSVSDVTDGKLVHLAGLNFNRAWAMRGVSSALSKNDKRRVVFDGAARRHLEAGWRYIFTGHYEGEHWLATFAAYVLTDVGINSQENHRN